VDELVCCSGRQLFAQGEAVTRVYVVKEGLIKQVRDSRRGRRFLVSVHGRGAVIGLFAAIEQRDHVTTAIALTDARLALIAATPVEATLRALQAMSIDTLKILAHELRQRTVQCATLGQMDARDRLKAVLSTVVHALPEHLRTCNGFCVPLTQQDIANAVGVSREHAARMLRELEERQILLRRRGQLLCTPYGLTHWLGAAGHTARPLAPAP
jgi:CRP-like cAMP-binding protein